MQVIKSIVLTPVYLIILFIASSFQGCENHQSNADGEITDEQRSLSCSLDYERKFTNDFSGFKKEYNAQWEDAFNTAGNYIIRSNMHYNTQDNAIIYVFTRQHTTEEQRASFKIINCSGEPIIYISEQQGIEVLNQFLESKQYVFVKNMGS